MVLNMPRKVRISRLNRLHHVLFRGVNGEKTFYDDRDRTRFCLLLQESCEKHGLIVHGFCIMSNHIHLVLEPILDSLQKGVHAFAFRYAQYFNRRHKRRGYLFQDRYKSILVDDGTYLKRLIRYIHLNPVDAKLVMQPEQYKWSSFRAYLKQDCYVWLQTDRVLSFFGETPSDSIETLVHHTYQKIDAEVDKEAILKAHRKGIFGDKVTLELTTYNKNEDMLFSDLQGMSLEQIMRIICHHFKVTPEDLSSQSKNKCVINARSVLALFMRKSRFCSLEEVASYLGKNSGTISRLATRAEQNAELFTVTKNIRLELSKALVF